MIRPRPWAFKLRSAPPPDDAVRANETAIDQVARHSSGSSTGGSQGRGEPPIATRQDFRGEGVKVSCEVVGSGGLEGDWRQGQRGLTLVRECSCGYSRPCLTERQR